MSARILQLQKRSSYVYQNIQDKAACNKENRVFALADGTTQSFNSEKWAALITQKFVEAPNFESEKIINLFTDCVQQFNDTKFTFSSNPAIAVLEKAKMAKGASTTFLGMQFVKDNKVNVIGCGDTNLFIVNEKGKIINCFPFNTIDGLNTNNNFINTVQLVNHEIDTSFFQTKQLESSKNLVYIMATDALSRLFLKNAETIKEVMKINNFKMLHNFCLKYWNKKELEDDDISAVIIKSDGNDKVVEIIPPPDFAFPKEAEVGFTPTTILNSTEQNFTDMQMHDIFNQFSGVARDFHEVKRNQKIIQLLLIIAIGLALLNFAGLTYLWYENNEKKGTQKKTEQINIPFIKFDTIHVNQQTETK